MRWNRSFIKNRIRWWWQRRTRGFDDTISWDLSKPLAVIILPRLRLFRDRFKSGEPQAYPCIFDGYTVKQWGEELDVMVEAFEYIVLAEADIVHLPQDAFNAESTYRDGIKQLGVETFGRRFLHLWS